METQLKRGMLEACTLKVLYNDDSYGYDIIKKLEPIVSISESTLYPILRRLEDKKALETYKEEHNGRIRKYYRITDIGIKLIDDFLEEWKQIHKIYTFIEELKND